MRAITGLKNNLAPRMIRALGAFALAVAAGAGASGPALGAGFDTTRFCLLEELAHAVAPPKRANDSLRSANAFSDTVGLPSGSAFALAERLVSEVAPLDRNRFSVRVPRSEPCCFSVETTSLGSPSWLGALDRDPYVTRFRSGVGPKTVPAEFSMQVPRWLGVDRNLPYSEFLMPKNGLSDVAQLSEVLKLPDGQVPAHITRAGEGGFSTAYFVHPEVPAQLLADWSAEAALVGDPQVMDQLRTAWAAQNATEVVKVRRLGRRPAEIMARGILRDVAVEEVASRLAGAATLMGEPLVRVARWRSSHDEILRGVIRQEVVHGPRVIELEAAAHTILSYKSGEFRGGLSQVVEASTLLADAGLTAEDAMRRIAALEEFYRRSHEPVRAYAARNELPGFMNRNGSGLAEVIGLDYNHGQNVAWSPTERRFVIFDW